jgi:hypothetical protein
MITRAWTWDRTVQFVRPWRNRRALDARGCVDLQGARSAFHSGPANGRAAIRFLTMTGVMCGSALNSYSVATLGSTRPVAT